MNTVPILKGLRFEHKGQVFTVGGLVPGHWHKLEVRRSDGRIFHLSARVVRQVLGRAP